MSGEFHADVSDEPTETTDRLLTVSGLRTIFRTEEGTVPAVDDVDFYVDRGEILGLVGESGAGKSVTARSVLRLIDPPGEIVDGRVVFDGQDVPSMDAKTLREFRGRRTGMVFQDPATTLNPTMPVGEQIAESMRAAGSYESAAARERAIDLLERVGIPNPQSRYHDYPHEFSGGQKQRIVIAIAIANDPDLLIADEATTALDVTTQAQILALLEELRDDAGMSIVFITHDLGVVEELCDRVAVLYAGSIVEAGPVDAILDAPAHPYTKGLLASIPELASGRTDEQARLDVIEGSMPDLTKEFEGCKYADRCPGATDECRVEHPPLEAVGQGRVAACYRSADIETIDYEYEHEARSIPWSAERESPDPTEPLLRGEGLEKYFRSGSTLDRLFGSVRTVRAVDGVDLDVYPGETLGIVGESGSGKSTLARTVLQLLEPTAGSVLYRGRYLDAADQKELRSVRRDLQLVFQDPQSSLNPRRTIGRILTRTLALHDIGESGDRRTRAATLLEAVGLDERYLDRYPHELSGGQQQRVGIARALAVSPEVIIADEPVSGLDVSIQAGILNLLADIQESVGLTYVFISHDLSVVSHVCDRVAVMYLGEIVESGPAESVFAPPYHPYTEALLAAVPGQRTTRQDGDAILLEGEVPDPSNVPTGCRFHPRCPHKIGEVCETEVPDAHAEDGGEIRCHLLAEEYRTEREEAFDLD